MDVYGQQGPWALLRQLFDPVVEALAEVPRHLEDLSIRDKFHDISSTVHNGGAMVAVLEMLFHPRAESRIDLVVDEVRDFAPDLYTTDLNYHWVTRAALSAILFLPATHHRNLVRAHRASASELARDGLSRLLQ